MHLRHLLTGQRCTWALRHLVRSLPLTSGGAGGRCLGNSKWLVHQPRRFKNADAAYILATGSADLLPCENVQATRAPVTQGLPGPGAMTWGLGLHAPLLLEGTAGGVKLTGYSSSETAQIKRRGNRLDSHPSVSAGDWFQDPAGIRIRGCASPLYKTA